MIQPSSAPGGRVPRRLALITALWLGCGGPSADDLKRFEPNCATFGSCPDGWDCYQFTSSTSSSGSMCTRSCEHSRECGGGVCTPFGSGKRCMRPCNGDEECWTPQRCIHFTNLYHKVCFFP